MPSTAPDVDTDTRKHGFTSWFKAKLLGARPDGGPVDAKFIADVSGIKKVGRYEVLHKLGQGSMGMVFLGRDPYIGRNVAIKISRPSKDLSNEKADKYRERFFVEAQSAGRLLHPNIVAIYDAGMYRDFCYITMEHIDGPTLEKYCRKDTLLPMSKAVETIITVCRALDYAHKMGVVHRDIKPSNVMLDKIGGVKITDFGIARIDLDHSSQKGIVGSPCYMSPEQVKEEEIEDKSDIFSLGCVLYELLTGEKAFSGDNYFSILYRITHEEPIPVRGIRPEVPDILQKIIRKALAKNTNVRYQTCMDFGYDLRVALRGLKGTIRKSKVEDVVDYVHRVPFFENFTKDQVREILMASDIIKVTRSKVVVVEGEIDDSFFIILSGKAAVRKNGKLIALINRGECFGEMSYLSGQSRAATVVAATDCVLMKISAALLDKAPESIHLLFFKQFAMTLLTRLTKSNQK